MFVTRLCACVILVCGMSVCYVQVADHNQFNTFATLPLDEVRFCLDHHLVISVNDESLGLLT